MKHLEIILYIIIMNGIKYSIPFLKEELSKYNLSTKGNKSDLQTRLLEHYDKLRNGWNTDIVYISDKMEFSKTDEIYLGTRYNTINGNGLLRFEKNSGNYDMYLDRNLLKQYIVEHRKIPKIVIEAIINIYTSKIKKTEKSIIFPVLNEPVKFKTGNNTNEDIKKQHPWIKTKLYQHQIESIHWMKKLEQKIKTNTLTYKYKTNNESYRVFPDFDTSLLFDIENKKIVIGSKQMTTYHYMKTSGGILSDDVGLGKTLTIIGLFIEHNNQYKIYNKIDPIEFNFYPNCNCNLVICPGYLVDQWSTEIFKHVNPPLKHYIITGKKQHEELSYKDILTSDVIIISDKFLKSKYYTSLSTTFSELQLNNEDPLKIKSPILNFIEWSRIVLDEGHMILSNTLTLDIINNIPSSFRWYVSATPVIQNNLISNIIKFLKWNVENENIQPFINSFYIARTKEQLKKNIMIPDYEEEIDLISMTCFEKQVYDNCKKIYSPILLRQLCSSILICNEFKEQEQKTLKEFQEYLMDGNQKKIEIINELKDKKLKNVSYYEKLIERDKNEIPDDYKNQTLINIETLKKEIVEHEIEKTNIVGFIQYQKNILEKMKEDHQCLICFETIDKKNIMITTCCHVYCETCIKKIEKCSICRQTFSITYLNINEDMQTKLIHHHGSKIAKLIYHLQKLKSQTPTFKVLIYSQWTRMLSIISNSLNLTQLDHVICNNNIKMIKSTLDKFQNKTNIMLLSMQTHQSGLDLHNVTHIFFMDVLYGSKEEIEKKEKQAIGRGFRLGQTKKIKIVRLIMKDTVEYS